MDPATVFPVEIFSHVLGMLTDPKDILSAGLACKGWRRVAEDNLLWDKMCAQLWADKVYVPERYRRLRLAGQAKKAYALSLIDGSRQHITKQELCAMEWYFRFKGDAGEQWTRNDPWWLGEPATVVRYKPDGSYCRNDMPFNFNWRFVPTSCGRKGPLGSFVRINDFPTNHVTRHKNWGFLMQSCWVFLASFPLPRKGQDPDLEDDNLEINVEVQRLEALLYNTGMIGVVFRDTDAGVGEEDDSMEDDSDEDEDYIAEVEDENEDGGEEGESVHGEEMEGVEGVGGGSDGGEMEDGGGDVWAHRKVGGVMELV